MRGTPSSGMQYLHLKLHLVVVMVIRVLVMIVIIRIIVIKVNSRYSICSSSPGCDHEDGHVGQVEEQKDVANDHHYGCDGGGYKYSGCGLGLGEIGPKDPNFKIETWALGF